MDGSLVGTAVTTVALPKSTTGVIADMKKSTKKLRTTSERKFQVRAELSNFQLANAKSALTLQVYVRRKKIGELQVGRGALYWWGNNRKLEERVPGGRFAEKKDQLAYGTGF